MLRMLAILMAVSFPAYAKPCTNADLQAKWTLYAGPVTVDIEGGTVERSMVCNLHVDENNVIPFASSVCRVTDTMDGVVTTYRRRTKSGFMIYGHNRGEAYAKRFAFVVASVGFNMEGCKDCPPYYLWSMVGQQEHDWRKRKARNCARQTIHGLVYLQRADQPGIVGSGPFKIVWRRP